MKWHPISPVSIFVYNALGGALREHSLQGRSSITCRCRCSRRLPLPACLLLRQQRSVAWAQWGRWGTDTAEDKWPHFLIRKCVSLQNTEAPDSALNETEWRTCPGPELALQLQFTGFVFYHIASLEQAPAQFFISDHWWISDFAHFGFSNIKWSPCL